MSAETQLLPERFPEATELLVEAFFDNPAHVYIAPDPATRAKKLRWLLARNLWLQSSVGRGFCTCAPRLGETNPFDDSTRLVAMGFWHAPGSATVGLATMLRHGLVLAPLQLGIAGLRRMLETTEAVEAQRRAAQGEAEAWYLHNMVVAQDQRGSGLGSALLRQQLREVVDPAGQRAILATQRAENVEFYARLGFEVASKARLGSGEHAFTNWVLIRPAGAPN